MALTGAFNGTRVNDSTVATNWSRFQVGGGAPSSESPLAYQGGLSVNSQVKATTSSEGIDYDHSATASFDMSAAANRLWFVKIIVSDSFAINLTRGAEVGCGEGSGAFDRFVLSGSQSVLSVYDEYPAQGGYLITAVAPSQSDWQDVLAGTEEGPVGSPTQTAVDYFYGATRMSTGAAKSENLALDSIDIGTGLTITGTTPDANFKNFYFHDQNGDITNTTPTTSNRWGVATGSGEAVRAIGMLSIGNTGGTLTTFTDTAAVVTWPDAYTDVGLFGATFYCNNASNVHVMDSLLISEGAIDTGTNTVDTRADLIITGTTAGATFTSAATVNNFRNITLTSVCTIAGANYECQLLTPGSATIGTSATSTVIRTNSLANVACYQTLNTGTPDVSYTDFIQTGAGHAMLIDTAGTYTLDNLSFTGYGANDTAASALDVTLVSASNVTINLTGTTQPTVNDTAFTGGGVVVFVATVTLTVTVQNAAGVALPGVSIAVFETDGTPVTAWTTTDDLGQLVDSGVVQAIGAITIRVRQSSNTASFNASTGVATNIITTAADHKFNTADAILYDKNGGTVLSDLTDLTTYYVRNLSATTVSLHTTAAGAIANTGIRTLTPGSSETHLLNPVRYKNNNASSNIAADNVSLTITLVEDIIASDV